MGGKCAAPPEELAKASKCGSVRLALLGSQLFWTEQQSGRVRAVAVTGGDVAEVASGQVAPGRIAIDEHGVYWVASGDGTSGSSEVMAAALPLGNAPVALKTAPGTDPFVGVAVQAGKLYYGLLHDIHSISTDPGDATDVIVGVSFARNDTMEPDGVPDGLSVHGDRVYWVITDVGSSKATTCCPGRTTRRAWVIAAGCGRTTWVSPATTSTTRRSPACTAAQVNVPAVAVASSSDDSQLEAFAVTSSDAYFAEVGGRLSRHGAGATRRTGFPADAVHGASARSGKKSRRSCSTTSMSTGPASMLRAIVRFASWRFDTRPACASRLRLA